MSDVTNKLNNLIIEWEELTSQDLCVLALRTAAILSCSDSVPAEIIKALTEIENQDSKVKCQHIYLLVKYLRKLVGPDPI